MDGIEQLSLFQHFSLEQLDLLRPLFVCCEYYAGTVIFEQGEPADFLYLVISGEAAIQFKPDDGAEITIARVRSGGVVGWSAAIGRQRYTSAALCTQATQLLRVRGADLQALFEQRPDIGELFSSRLAENIAERVHGSHDQVVALLENGLRTSISYKGG